MKRSYVSYGFLMSFLAVLLCLRFWQLSFYPSMLLLGIGGMAGVFLVLSFVLQKRTTFFGIFAAISIGSLLAMISAAHAVHVTGPDDIESFALGQSVSLHGWIVEPADVRPTVTKLTVAVNGVKDQSGTHQVRGRILFNDNGEWPLLQYGDEVRIDGKLTAPEVIDTFDYPHYLELSGVRALVTRGRIRHVHEETVIPAFARTWSVIRYLSVIRTAVEDRIGLVLPEPQASLLAGLLTGTRRGLPVHVGSDFRTAGITHIIAVSGYNVTIVMTLLGGLLFWIPVKKRLLPLSFAAAAFCLFVGAGAPVVRATIMGILGLIALSTERVTTTRLSILWTAFLMAAMNPLTLWYDASFQLSFLAVMGLSELSLPLKRLFRRVPETLAIRESLTATVAAQIATIPLSVILFRQFSLVAPLTNILVAPLIPLSMLLGSIATALSLLWMPLGLFVGYFTWSLLELIIGIAHLCAMVPFAAIRF